MIPMNNLSVSASTEWLRLIHNVMDEGKEVISHGQKTLELIGYQSYIYMRHSITMIPDRKVSLKFMAAEASWILKGDNKLSTLTPYAPYYERFSDDGVRLNGAYGPKVVDQIGYVVKTLREDPNSRQAVINLWRERPGPSRDIPCTLSMQFMIRDECLECIVSMRSSDAWLGWVYDVFSFSTIARYVVIEYNRQVGNWKSILLGDLKITAGSQHLYEKDWTKVEHIMDQELINSAGFSINYGAHIEKGWPLHSPGGIETTSDLINSLDEVANARTDTAAHELPEWVRYAWERRYAEE